MGNVSGDKRWNLGSHSAGPYHCLELLRARPGPDDRASQKANPFSLPSGACVVCRMRFPFSIVLPTVHLIGRAYKAWSRSITRQSTINGSDNMVEVDLQTSEIQIHEYGGVLLRDWDSRQSATPATPAIANSDRPAPDNAPLPPSQSSPSLARSLARNRRRSRLIRDHRSASGTPQ